MWRWQSSRTAVVGAAIVVFVVCCVLPVGYLLTVSLSSVDAFSALLLDARQRQLLYNTALLGTGTALLATAIGAPLGIALARIALPRKAVLRLALAAPVLLPPYIVGLAWTYLGSSRGWLATLAGHDLLSAWTYSLPAAIVVLSVVFYPLSMLATEVAMRRIDGRLEEAALVVAPPGRVLSRITLPLAAPGVFAAALVIFVLAVSEFGVPGLLRVRVYTTEVFTAFAALYDFTRAILLAVPLLLLCLIVAAVAAALLGDRLVITRRSAGTRPALFDEWQRPATLGALVVLTVALVLPLAILVSEAMAAQSISAGTRGVRSRHREQPRAGDGRCNGRCQRRRVAWVRPGQNGRPNWPRCRHPLHRPVRGAEHDCRRGPDSSVESAGAVRRGVWNGRHASSGVSGEIRSGRSARARRQCPIRAGVARGGRRRQRRGMAPHHVGDCSSADAARAGCGVGGRVRPGVRGAWRQHSRRAAG